MHRRPVTVWGMPFQGGMNFWIIWGRRQEAKVRPNPSNIVQQELKKRFEMHLGAILGRGALSRSRVTWNCNSDYTEWSFLIDKTQPRTRTDFLLHTLHFQDMYRILTRMSNFVCSGCEVVLVRSILTWCILESCILCLQNCWNVKSGFPLGVYFGCQRR